MTAPFDRQLPISIAIVDDEAGVRRSLQRLCSVLGMNATAYESGRAFLNALELGSVPDCLLLDTHMPEMTGLDVQRILGTRSRTFPTVVITADDAPEIRARVLAAGATDCLRKPMGAEELIAAIERAVAGPGPRFSTNPTVSEESAI
jgi:FixJ family two-component response regulator